MHFLLYLVAHEDQEGLQGFSDSSLGIALDFVVEAAAVAVVALLCSQILVVVSAETTERVLASPFRLMQSRAVKGEDVRAPGSNSWDLDPLAGIEPGPRGA
eukprot:505839-Rhodomonas_salina.1